MKRNSAFRQISPHPPLLAFLHPTLSSSNDIPRRRSRHGKPPFYFLNISVSNNEQALPVHVSKEKWRLLMNFQGKVDTVIGDYWSTQKRMSVEQMNQLDGICKELEGVFPRIGELMYRTYFRGEKAALKGGLKSFCTETFNLISETDCNTNLFQTKLQIVLSDEREEEDSSVQFVYSLKGKNGKTTNTGVKVGKSRILTSKKQKGLPKLLFDFSPLGSYNIIIEEGGFDATMKETKKYMEIFAFQDSPVVRFLCKLRAIIVKQFKNQCEVIQVRGFCKLTEELLSSFQLLRGKKYLKSPKYFLHTYLKYLLDENEDWKPLKPMFLMIIRWIKRKNIRKVNHREAVWALEEDIIPWFRWIVKSLEDEYYGENEDLVRKGIECLLNRTPLDVSFLIQHFMPTRQGFVCEKNGSDFMSILLDSRGLFEVLDEIFSCFDKEHLLGERDEEEEEDPQRTGKKRDSPDTSLTESPIPLKYRMNNDSERIGVGVDVEEEEKEVEEADASQDFFERVFFFEGVEEEEGDVEDYMNEEAYPQNYDFTNDRLGEERFLDELI